MTDGVLCQGTSPRSASWVGHPKPRELHLVKASPRSASRAMSVPSAPMVFQCGACHRVISDSNQLLAAVAELDVLVLDAVVGISIVEGGEAFSELRCSACQHNLGKCFTQPPQPSLTDLVHRKDAPRYALSRAALQSYVLGSAQAEHAVNGAPAGGAAGNDSPSPEMLQRFEPNGRLEALETSETAVRLQLAQLMRVVLALDERLRSLEDAGATQPTSKRKR